VEMSARSLRALAPVVEALAAAEGLEAHARAVRVRLPQTTSRRPARRK
jgi:histidinol dehydrogenase